MAEVEAIQSSSATENEISTAFLLASPLLPEKDRKNPLYAMLRAATLMLDVQTDGTGAMGLQLDSNAQCQSEIIKEIAEIHTAVIPAHASSKEVDIVENEENIEEVARSNKQNLLVQSRGIGNQIMAQVEEDSQKVQQGGLLLGSVLGTLNNALSSINGTNGGGSPGG